MYGMWAVEKANVLYVLAIGILIRVHNKRDKYKHLSIVFVYLFCLVSFVVLLMSHMIMMQGKNGCMYGSCPVRVGQSPVCIMDLGISPWGSKKLVGSLKARCYTSTS